MPLHRRQFLTLLGAAAGVSLLPIRRTHAARGEPDRYFQWQEAAPGAHVALGEGGNSLVVVGPEGTVLVDCKNAPFGACLRREAETWGRPLQLVINTHHHADHTGGNHAFVADIPVMAHPACKPRIAPQVNRYISQAKEAITRLSADEELPAARRRAREGVIRDARAYHDRLGDLAAANFEPTRTMDSDAVETEVAGERIVLRHFGPGHTDNDVVVYFPTRNVLHTGDLLFHRRHPFIDRPAGATSRGWQESLRRVAALCDPQTVVVPGHGDLTDLGGIKTQIEYFDKVRDLVAAARKEGKSKAEVQRLPADAFAGYGGENAWPMVLGAMFDEAEAGG